MSFDLEGARAYVAAVPDQRNETLRLACDEIERLQMEIEQVKRERDLLEALIERGYEQLEALVSELRRER